MQTTKTQDALEKSIQKWEGIVVGNVPEMRGENCELCLTFARCVGCPVTADGHRGCNTTPYIDFVNADLGLEFGQDDKFVRYNHSERSLRAAKREVEYLKSLRPLAKKMDLALDLKNRI